MNGTRWTEHEIEALRNIKRGDLPGIAAWLGRSYRSAKKQRVAYGFGTRKRPWTPEDRERFRALILSGMTAPAAGAAMRAPRKRTGPKRSPVTGEQPIDRPARPCANCGRSFRPTTLRRLLCWRCYIGANAPAHGTAFEG